MDNVALDMPLNFEIFLPVSISISTTCRFDKDRRTVQVTRDNTEHPFFFGNAVNFKRMNLLLEKELTEVVKTLPSTIASGVTYDLSYSVQRRGQVPFLHQLVATERGSNGQRCIRFDFVLALVFDGADVPLPAYYKAPIVSQWLAYGMAGGRRSPTEWSVLVPKWKTAGPAVCLRSLSTLTMMHRLLKVQQCDLFAEPFSLKFAFTMVTEERGEGYQQMSVADMALTVRTSRTLLIVAHNVFLPPSQTLFYLVIRDLYQSANDLTRRDRLSRSSKLLSIRKQQVRARGIYNMLAYGASQNEIGSGFIFAFFTNLYIPPPPSSSKWTVVKEMDGKTVYDFPLEMDVDAPRLKRRRSM